jgi:hypothetical protein
LITYIYLSSTSSSLSPYSPHPHSGYVFYNDVDTLTPFMDAEEFTWEPKYAAKIPLLFLENFTASLIRSTYSWNLRCVGW